MFSQSQGTGRESNGWLSPSAALAQLSTAAPLADATVATARAVRFGFRVGALGLLVGKGVLSELLRAPEIFPIPNVDSAIRGYVNLQGALVPVWSLQQLIGASEDTERVHLPSDSVLVLGRGDRRIGIVVDGLPKSLKQLEAVKQSPPPLGVLDSYVKDAQVGDGGIWFEFDYESFFRAQTDRAGA